MHTPPAQSAACYPALQVEADGYQQLLDSFDNAFARAYPSWQPNSSSPAACGNQEDPSEPFNGWVGDVAVPPIMWQHADHIFAPIAATMPEILSGIPGFEFSPATNTPLVLSDAICNLAAHASNLQEMVAPSDCSMLLVSAGCSVGCYVTPWIVGRWVCQG